VKRDLKWSTPLLLLATGVACGARTDLGSYGSSTEEEGHSDSDGDSDSGGTRSSGGARAAGGAWSSGGAASGGAESKGTGGAPPCPLEHFRDDPTQDDSECVPWSDCVPGGFELEPPGTFSDRRCAPCPKDSFSAEVNQQSCRPFQVCLFGATIDQPGTSTKDVVCREPDQFAAVEFDAQVTEAGMTVTEFGPYLGLNVMGSPNPVILHSSPDGLSYVTWEIESEYGATLRDLTAIGTDIYASVLTQGTSDYIGDAGAAIIKFNADGDEQWRITLERNDEWFLNVLVTNDGTELIVARQVLPVDCSSESTCEFGVESHLVLSHYDQDGNLTSETRHNKYFNFAALGDVASGTGFIGVAGELTGSSGIHTFDASGSLLKKYPEEEVAGGIGHILTPAPTGELFAMTSWADPLNSSLLSVGPTAAHVLGPVPNAGSDMLQAMIATDQELLLVGRDWSNNQTLFVRLNHNGELLERQVDAGPQTGYFSEVVRAPSGEIFVGGVGDSDERHVAIIRPWNL